MESTVFAEDSFTNEAPVAVAKPVGPAPQQRPPATTHSNICPSIPTLFYSLNVFHA